MATVKLSSALRKEYQRLFATCCVRPERAHGVETIVEKVVSSRKRYAAAGEPLGVPWFVVGVLHSMESSLSFDRHLHNGDPLTGRTVRVPAGRPATGVPPFTWEESAADALATRGMDRWADWSLAGVLYQLEGYNGWGYRLYHQHVVSPYLWAASTHYASGKYVDDGTWSDTAVSKQVGAAVLLRRMAERGDLELDDQPAHAADAPALVARYATKEPADPAAAAQVRELQRWLGTFPGIFVKIDGIAGPRTSAAYRLVTGAWLPGDPRGE